MPDLQHFSVTRSGANVQVGPSALTTAPEFVISGQLCDSTSGAVLADFTGANAIHVPAVLATLTAAQHDELLQLVFRFVLHSKLGI